MCMPVSVWVNALDGGTQMRINRPAWTPNPLTARWSRDKDSHGDESSGSEQTPPKECSRVTGGVLESQGLWLGSFLLPRPLNKKKVGR